MENYSTKKTWCPLASGIASSSRNHVLFCFSQHLCQKISTNTANPCYPIAEMEDLNGSLSESLLVDNNDSNEQLISEEEPRTLNNFESISTSQDNGGDDLRPVDLEEDVDDVLVMGHSRLWNNLSSFTEKHSRFILIVCFALVWPFGVYSSKCVLKSLDSNFAFSTPPEGTLSFEAQESYINAFQSKPESNQIVILISRKGASMKTSGSRFFRGVFGANVRHSLFTNTDSILFNETEYFVGNLTEELKSQYNDLNIWSFYGLNESQPIIARQGFVSKNEADTIMTIEVPEEFDTKSKAFKFIDHLMKHIRESRSRAPSIEVSITGLSLLSREMKGSRETDQSRLDFLILPLAIIILGIVLECPAPLLLLPMITTMSTIFVSNSVLVFIMTCIPSVKLNDGTPSIMMSLIIAMSIDYSLFYLSRILEEIKKSPTPPSLLSLASKQVLLQQSNSNTMCTAGHSILVSGSTLAVCILGLAMLRCDSLVALAVGGSVAVSSCVFVNLTLLPSMLNTKYLGVYLVYSKICVVNTRSCTQWIGQKFEIIKHNYNEWQKARKERQNYQRDNSAYFENIDDITLLNNDDNISGVTGITKDLEDREYDRVNLTHAELNPELVRPASFSNNNEGYDKVATDNEKSGSLDIVSMSTETSRNKYNSPWLNLGKFLLLNQKRSIVILSTVIAVAILPVSIFTLKLNTSISFDYIVPRGSASLETFHKLGSVFSEGMISPYQIVFDGTKTSSRIVSAKGFNFIHETLLNLTLPHVSLGVRNGKVVAKKVSYVPGTRRLADVDSPTTGNSILESDVVNGKLVQALFSNIVASNKEKDTQPTIISKLIESGLNEDIDGLREKFESVLTNDADPKRMPIKFLNRKDVLISQFPNFTATPDLNSFIGIASVNGTLVPFEVYELATICEDLFHMYHNSSCPIVELRTLDFLSEKTVSKNKQAAYISTRLNVDPYSSDGLTWLKSARYVLEKQKEELPDSPYEVYIVGGASSLYDELDQIYSSFPKMILVTVVLVFVWMGISFQSIGVPLRSVISIATTLCYVYGYVVLVYQYGLLNWLGIDSLAKTGEIYFLIPIISFTVIVGLGLDYDVFLTTRVLEYRHLGYDHISSILLGLHKTGTIITAAGIIMCVSFGGLLLSQTYFLNQLSLYLVTAVLLDTFVVRTILVPSVLGLVGEKWGWYPKTFPRATKTLKLE